jgi:predicted amidohydrolase
MQRSIGVAQSIPVPGDAEANIGRHLALVSAAAERHAQVLVFPELSLTGYELRLAPQLAFTPADSRLLPLVEMAVARSITIIAGAPVRIGARLHIGAFILSADGTIEVYTKRYLGAFSAAASRDGTVPPAETDFFQPGNRDPLVRFSGHAGAVAVCADTGRASHPAQAAGRGARTYLASMFVIPSEYEREKGNLEAAAVRHSMAVAFANFGGPTGGLASAGRSAVWSDTGELLAQLDSTGAGVAVATERDGGWNASTFMLHAP